MALIRADQLLDTILAFIEEQRPVYETIIDKYYHGRELTLFLGRRAVIPTSSIPSIEVTMTGETLGWHSCRTQQEEPSVELDITTDNAAPELAIRLEAALVTLTTRILASPPHLRPHIKGTQAHMYDSLPTDVRYGTAGNGRLRVATVNWRGKQIEHLANRLFQYLAVPPPLEFPKY